MNVTSISHQSGADPLSEEAFLALGIQSLAYLRRANINGKRGWAAYAADGTRLSVFEGDDPVFVRATLRQNDLIPVSVH